MGKIWIVSDTHFGHDKDFLWGPRGFKSIEEHDATIVKNWNDLVAPEDTVYHLGDVWLGDNTHGMNVIKSLNGTIHFIRGNHDTDTRVQMLEKEGYSCLPPAHILKFGKYHFYLSHYPTICSNRDIDKPLKCQTINICGHSHCKDAFCDFNKGLIYHAELDAHENKLILLEQIINDIKEAINND